MEPGSAARSHRHPSRRNRHRRLRRRPYPPELLDCVDLTTAEGVPIIVASRCGAGTTLRRTYAVPGTEIDLQARGAIMAGAISAPKARLRLAVAIATGQPLETAFPVY